MKTPWSSLALVAILCIAADPKDGIRRVNRSAETGTARAVVVDDVPLLHTAQVLPVNERGELVGAEPAAQVGKVLDNLSAVLGEARAGFDRLVKVNVYAANPEIIEAVDQAFARKFAAAAPAVSYVVGQLSQPGALVALDAVAVAGGEPLATVKRTPHAAVMPAGARVYISGQAQKGANPIEATRKTLENLRATLKHLGLTTADVVQAKAFLTPIAAARDVRKEFAAFFGERALPPLVFVEWSSVLPIEIELIAWAGKERPGESIEYLTPPALPQSPVFSRVARINHGPTIYLGGLYATQAGDGKAEVHDIFAQLKALLEKTGSDLKHLAKATYYCANDDVSKALNELRPNYYDKDRPPAASKAMVAGTGRSQRAVTLDMIAVPK